MKMRNLLFFIALLIFLIGTVSATDVSEDTNSVDDSNQLIMHDSQSKIVNDDSVNDNLQIEKDIIKDNKTNTDKDESSYEDNVQEQSDDIITSEVDDISNVPENQSIDDVDENTTIPTLTTNNTIKLESNNNETDSTDISLIQQLKNTLLDFDIDSFINSLNNTINNLTENSNITNLTDTLNNVLNNFTAILNATGLIDTINSTYNNISEKLNISELLNSLNKTLNEIKQKINSSDLLVLIGNVINNITERTKIMNIINSIQNIIDHLRQINIIKVTATPTSGIMGEKLILKATVTNCLNMKITGGNLIFKINGITVKDNGKLTGSTKPLKVKVIKGVATATITLDTSMKSATYYIASYVGTKIFKTSVSDEAPIQVYKRNATIEVSTNKKTIKQGQILTLTAKVYDTTHGEKSTNLTKDDDEFVLFKINGITLKDANGDILKVKVNNGVAKVNYTVPLGLSGVTDTKSMTVKNHTILAQFYNKNYQDNISNTTIFQIERSNITITITNVTVNNKTHKLSLNTIIKDYLGNNVIGPNKFVIKINGITLKNGTSPMYYYSTDGILTIKNIDIPSLSKYTNIELVTQDRLSYKNQRNSTTVIKVLN